MSLWLKWLHHPGSSAPSSCLAAAPREQLKKKKKKEIKKRKRRKNSVTSWPSAVTTVASCTLPPAFGLKEWRLLFYGSLCECDRAPCVLQRWKQIASVWKWRRPTLWIRCSSFTQHWRAERSNCGNSYATTTSIERCSRSLPVKNCETARVWWVHTVINK